MLKLTVINEKVIMSTLHVHSLLQIVSVNEGPFIALTEAVSIVIRNHFNLTITLIKLLT